MEVSDYLNSTVWCKVSPSKIHGVGVVAIRNIPKGKKITNYTIEDSLNGLSGTLLISEEDFAKVKKEIQELILDRIILRKNSSYFLIQNPNQDAIIRSFMNHSETPNTDGNVTLRDVEKGEELTFDYNMYGVENIHELSINHMKHIFDNS